MSEEPNPSTIDPDLEARIAALVVGEASDLERDQLNRLIESRPELQSLKKQFESVHRLLTEVGSGESDSMAGEWKLPTEKRSAVLAAFDGKVTEPSVKPFVVRLIRGPLLMSSSTMASIAKVAVLLCVVGLVGFMLLIPATQSARRVSQTRIEHFDVGTESLDESVFFGSDPQRNNRGAAATSDFSDLPASRPQILESFERKSDSQTRSLGITDDVASVPPAPTADDALSIPNASAWIARSNGTRHRFDDSSTNGKVVDNNAGQNWQDSGLGGLAMQPPASGNVDLFGGTTLQYSIDAKDSISSGENVPADVAVDFDNEMDGVAARASGEVIGQQDQPVPPAMQDRFGRPQEAKVDEFAFNGDVELNLPAMSMLSPRILFESETPIVGDFAVGNGRQSLRENQVAGEQVAGEQAGKRLRDSQSAQIDNWGLDIAKNEPMGEESAPIDSDGDRLSDELDKNDWKKLSRRRIDRFGELVPESIAVAGRELYPNRIEPLVRDYTSDLATTTRGKQPAAGLDEKSADREAFSTFSLHVSDVSFKLAQAALARGEWPEAAKVRIEEFVNAFDYGDPLPSADEKVSCRLEQSIHPFLQQRNLLRVSMRTAATGRASSTPLRLTLLLDNSGSMERADRRQAVRQAFALLAEQLTPIDQITAISFARQPRLLADRFSGAQSNQLVQLIDDLPSEGGTNIEAALNLAFEKAREQHQPGAQNRIIMLTDGAVNLGDANPDRLSQMITTMRDAGIAFDAAGISAEGLNDEVLEALTRKGDGRYYLLDSIKDADNGFARQIAGALRPSAKNVKVQVEFNPLRVGQYKLLGFEKHLLNQEDFRNDKVDAAEMAAAEAGVAVYQFEVKPDGEGDVGSVSVRFQDLSTGQMVENRWPIPFESDPPRAEDAAPSLRIATSAAMLAAKLRGEPLGELVELQTLAELISDLPARVGGGMRVGALQQMINQARQLSGN